MLQKSLKITDRRAFGLGLVGLGLTSASAQAQSSAQTRPYTIVALGDSLTAGYGVRRSEAFPARIDARLKAAGYPASIINAGLSGDTSAGALARFDFAVPRGANGLLLAIGSNDMLQGLSPAAAQANIEAIIMRAKARRMRVVLLGMRAPTNWGVAYRTAFDGIYPALARKHGLALDPFLLEGVALNPALNQADGIHPTAVGADRIAARLTPFVARSFGLRASPLTKKR
jgi:acyl-CoA thioesterase I